MSHELLFNSSLLLADLAKKNHPAISSYRDLKYIDLHQLSDIDSAGVAYLVQIKIQYPTLLLINASAKLLVLAELYGVENLFGNSDL